MDRLRRETWIERVERLKESGLTVKEFAAEIGVNDRSLSWWRWHLRSTAPDAPKRALVRRPVASIAKAPAISPLTFVEMTTAIDADRLEVVLPSSVRVRVRPGFDSATLGQLLDVLERR